MQYKNAAEILPEETIKEIQRYFSGGLLWVPHIESHKERAELVVKLVEKNVPVKEVAQLAQLTPRHVRRLVRETRLKKKRTET